MVDDAHENCTGGDGNLICNIKYTFTSKVVEGVCDPMESTNHSHEEETIAKKTPLSTLPAHVQGAG